MPNSKWQAHVNSYQHRTHQEYANFHSALEQAESDKNGTLIDGEFDFDIVGLGSTTTLSRAVKKTANNDIRMIRVDVASCKKHDSRGRCVI